MKKATILFILTVFGLWAQSKQGIVPNISLKMLDGTKVQLYDILNEGPGLIDFWAIWCEPCKKEMVHLERFHQQYADQGFKVLAINQDTPRSISKVKSYLRSKRFTFLVALDPNQQISQKLNARLLPTSILVDQKGNILWRHQGFFPGDEEEIQKQILLALEKRTTTVE